MKFYGLEQASFCQAGPGKLIAPYRHYRKDEIALWRARFGHTHLTHSYILRKDLPTVRHILVVCNHFVQAREYIFGRRDVLDSTHTHSVVFKRSQFYDTF